MLSRAHPWYIVVEPPSTADSVTIPPFLAYFPKAGISKCHRFHLYGTQCLCSISFDITSSGDEDQQLNIIQVKKVDSLFSLYHHIPSPIVSCWFNLSDTDFQVWRTLPSTPNPVALLLPPAGLPSPSSAIYDVCKSVKQH
jgi:hypothetical protein